MLVLASKIVPLLSWIGLYDAWACPFQWPPTGKVPYIFRPEINLKIIMMIEIIALIILQESHTYNQTNGIIRPSSSEKGSPSKRISPSSFPLRPSPSPKIHPQNNIPRPRPFFVNLGSSPKGTCNKDWKQGFLSHTTRQWHETSNFPKA